ncbi:hypothetical protein [Methylobacterium oryzae]|uniref:hypothetical protein n=1 Tax=Methylobacterium oryzae TaxID=334852 RepID=UPI002F34FE60
MRWRCCGAACAPRAVLPAARAAGTAAILARYGYGRPADADAADAVLDDIGGLRALIGALPAGRTPAS